MNEQELKQEAERKYPINKDCPKDIQSNHTLITWAKREAYIAGVLSRSGGVWVKASERLPEITKGYARQIVLRWKFEEITKGEPNIQLRVTTSNEFIDLIHSGIADRTKIEWMDDGLITPTDKQIVELMNVTGRMNILEAIEYVKGLQELLRFDNCPDMLIQNPYMLKQTGKPDEESKAWAADVIANYEKQKTEKPIEIRMNEKEYEKYKAWVSESPAADKGDAIDGWISVEKELPNEKTFVLTYHPLRDLYRQMYLFNNKWIIAGGFDKYPFDDVTHWRPLPQPPQSK